MKALSIPVAALFLATAACSSPTAPANSGDDVPVILFSPQPPTEGGNGAGKSGQCTGKNEDRPQSCKSQGGPGNQP